MGVGRAESASHSHVFATWKFILLSGVELNLDYLEQECPVALVHYSYY